MNLLVFGLGYTAQAFTHRMAPRCASIVGTKRAASASPGGESIIERSASSFPLAGKVVTQVPRTCSSHRGTLGEAELCEAQGRMGGVVHTSNHPGTPRPPPPAPPREGEGRRLDVTLRSFPGDEAALMADIAAADAILVSIPPDHAAPTPHDPVLAAFAEAIRSAPRLKWLGYLSTIGVYGDHDGAWIDEATTPAPVSRRSRARLATEEAWLALAGVPVHVFRIAGIYGPSRSAFDKLAAGTAKRIVKPGQVFNRIHVEDIGRILEASLDRPRPGAIYNVADDEPAPPQDVIVEAAQVAGFPLPPEIPFSDVELSPMAASFWGETKRVSNRLVCEELGVQLAYPTYREGLRAILTPPAGSRPA